MKSTILAVATLLMTTTVFAQQRVEESRPRPKITIDQWGGEGISLQVIKQLYPTGVEKISATATVHCGTASIDLESVDGSGGFLGAGKYYIQPAPYVKAAPEPIHAVGYVKKDLMTLIGIKDNDQTKPTIFILKKNGKSSIRPCKR